ncbi:hypothetical protein GCM10009664_15150 [Kitasatospora gansuensis]
MLAHVRPIAGKVMGCPRHRKRCATLQETPCEREARATAPLVRTVDGLSLTAVPGTRHFETAYRFTDLP